MNDSSAPTCLIVGSAKCEGIAPGTAASRGTSSVVVAGATGAETCSGAAVVVTCAGYDASRAGRSGEATGAGVDVTGDATGAAAG